MSLDALEGRIRAAAQAGRLECDAKTLDAAAATLIQDSLQVAQLSIQKPVVRREDDEIVVAGTAAAAGVKTATAKLRLGERDEELTLALTLRMPDTWRVSDGFSTLRGTVFDEWGLRGASLVLSSYGYEDAELGVDLTRGLHVVADCELPETLHAAEALVGSGPLRIHATLDESEVAVVVLDRRVSISMVSPDFDLRLSMPDGASVKPETLLTHLVPAVSLPSSAPRLRFKEIEMEIAPFRGFMSLSAGAAAEGGWTVGPVVIRDIRVEITAYAPTDRSDGSVAALIGGAGRIGDTDVDVMADLTSGLTISVTLWNFDLPSIASALGGDLTFPEELPHVTFPHVNLTLSPTDRTMSFAARASGAWPLPGSNGAATVKTAELSLSCDLRGKRAEGAVTVGGTGSSVVDGLTLGDFALRFGVAGLDDWSVSGNVNADVFGHPVALEAGYHTAGGHRALSLSTAFAPALDVIDVERLGSLSLSGFSLGLTSETDAHSGEDGGSGESGGGTSWTVSAGGRLRVEQVCDLAGTLELFRNPADGSTGIAFLPTNAAARVALPTPGKRPPVTLNLDFGEIFILRGHRDGHGNGDGGTAGREGDKPEWVFGSAVDLSFGGLPESLQARLPETIGTEFWAGDGAVTLKVDPIMAPVDFTIPPVRRGDIDIELGDARIFARNLEVTLGAEVRLAADLNLGLPSRLNYLFGENEERTGPRHEIFRTYDEAHPDRLFTLGLAAGTDGLSFEVRSSPFTFLAVDDHGWARLDLDEFGALGFLVPTLHFDAAKGTFEAEVGLDVERLAIPLTPLIGLLAAFKLDDLAALLPRSLPFEPINLVSREGHLKVDELVGFLERTAGAELPEEVAEALRALEKAVDRLPRGLARYLHITWPTSFHLKVATTTTGSLRLDFGVGRGTDLGAGEGSDPGGEQADPVRFLLPALAPTGLPQLLGFEIYGFSIGEVFGGALLTASVDARIDRFDLPTIVGSLALPPGGSDLLPASSETLQRRLILDEVFLVIFYQAGVPIPIPLFYEQLGIEYWGIEGLRTQAHVRLPMPSFNLVEALEQIGIFKEFFTDESFFFEEGESPEDMNLVFSTWSNYVELPQYLGSGKLGHVDKDPDSGFKIDGYAKATELLNALKRVLEATRELTINDLIQLVPLDSRVKEGRIGAGGISAHGAFALTTPKEFAEVAYERIDLEGDRLQSALAILPGPSEGAATDDRGLCLFFRGGFDIARAVSFEAMYALAATGAHFGTGCGIHGALGGDTVDVELQGWFAIDPSQPIPVGLAGHAHFRVLDQPLLQADVSLGPDGFAVSGLIDLFPGSPVRLYGTVEGVLSREEFRLAGGVEFTVGEHLTVAGAHLELDTKHFRLTGVCFNQSATFDIRSFERRVDSERVSGLRFEGELHPVVIGDVFRLTGKGPHGGPHAAIEVSFGPAFGLELSGAVDLLGISSAANIELSERGFEFHVSGSLLGLFACSVDVVAGSLTDGDLFRLSVTLEVATLSEIESVALGLLNEAARSAEQALDEARRTVDHAQRQVDGVIAQAQEQVDRELAGVRSLQGRINALQKRIDKLSWRPKDYPEWARLAGQRDALKAQLILRQTQLAMARAVLSFARAEIKVVTYVLTGVLKQIHDAANGARQALRQANEHLNAVKSQVGTGAKLAAFDGTLLEIHGVSFGATLNRVKGAKVALVVDRTFLGKRRGNEERAEDRPPPLRIELLSPEQVGQALVQHLLGRGH